MKVVFLHSAGSSADLWAQQRLAFAVEHEVRTPDLPGHGRSAEAPLESIEEMAAWVARAEGDLSDGVLVGHSMGASVALAYAATHDLRGLVLVGAAPRSHVPPDLPGRVAEEPQIAVERMATRAFGPATRAALVERASAYLLRTDPEVLARDLAASAAFDARPLLRRIGAPALVIVGADDRLTPLQDARALVRWLRRSDLVVIEGAGHMVMLERPREFNHALSSFLERL